MKNKIVSGYEKKRWYRVVKSLYIGLFAILLIGYNYYIFFETEDSIFKNFIITNAIIVFSMGAAEGLFWYIARSKWGYPKDDESDDSEK